MTSPTGSIRPLPYPLDYSEDIQSDTPNDPAVTNLTLEDWSTTDEEERVNIVLNLSLEEYVALATCIDVGRDIAYGDNSIYIWWIWVRSVISMALCDDILDCIETTESIQQAIANYALTSNINGSTPENAEILAMELVDNQAGCDNDNIYGMVRQLVDFVDSLNKDLLERLIAATQSMDALATLIKAIPVVETLPLDDALAFSNWLLDTIYSAYLSASTELLRVDTACDLFCLAQENGCLLSFQEARDYFYDKLGLTLDTSNPTQFLEDLIINNLTGVASFYGMYTLAFQLMAFGSSILEFLPEKIVRLVNAMFNDPNSDWSTECDGCAWSHVFDFTVDDGGFVPVDSGYGDRGVWSTGVGWIGTDVQISATPRYRRGMLIEKSFPDTELTRIDVLYDYIQGTVEFNESAFAIVMLESNITQASFSILFNDMVDGDDQEESLVDTRTCDEIRLGLSSSNKNDPAYSGTCIITRCTVYGTGTNPFI